MLCYLFVLKEEEKRERNNEKKQKHLNKLIEYCLSQRINELFILVSVIHNKTGF